MNPVTYPIDPGARSPNSNSVTIAADGHSLPKILHLVWIRREKHIESAVLVSPEIIHYAMDGISAGKQTPFGDCQRTMEKAVK